jgi:hypothetical protein
MTTKWSDTRFESIQLTLTAAQILADVNIEVAHVSAPLAGSELLLPEIAACVRRYKHIVESLEYGAGPISVTTVCLIDDYNHIRPANMGSLVTQHVNEVESHGVRIDYIVFEADLEVLKEEFLALTQDEYVVRYMQKHQRSPCSAHIEMWNLARLGRLATALPGFRRRGAIEKPFVGSQVLSILPRYYDTFEERATIALGRSGLAEVVTQINHAYFDADPPANLEYSLEVG